MESYEESDAFFDNLCLQVTIIGEASRWIQDNGYNLQQAWANCNRADWMIWLLARKAGELGWPSKPEVIKLVCKLARKSLPFASNRRGGIKQAIEATEAWADDLTGNSEKQDIGTAGVGHMISIIRKAAYTISQIDGATGAAHQAYYKGLSDMADIIRAKVSLEGVE